jgi:hypothetical protein
VPCVLDYIYPPEDCSILWCEIGRPQILYWKLDASNYFFSPKCFPKLLPASYALFRITVLSGDCIRGPSALDTQFIYLLTNMCNIVIFFLWDVGSEIRCGKNENNSTNVLTVQPYRFGWWMTSSSLPPSLCCSVWLYDGCDCCTVSCRLIDWREGEQLHYSNTGQFCIITCISPTKL